MTRDSLSLPPNHQPWLPLAANPTTPAVHNWPPSVQPTAQDVIAKFERVYDTGQHNHMCARIPLPTHLHISTWSTLLEADQDAVLVDLLQYGFPVNYTKDKSPAIPFTNHHSAKVHATAVEKYILKETSLGATIGPFKTNPLSSPLHLSPLQTVPKSKTGDPTARRVVLDLSFPHTGTSVNAGIPKDSYLGQSTHLTYPSVDALARLVIQHGKGCLLFKVDLSRAFRQLLLCPCCIRYCAYQWRHRIFIDLAFPYGIRSACLNCQRVAEAIVRCEDLQTRIQI